MQGHPGGLLGEEGGPTAGTLGDGVSGIESSEPHNPPEMLDGLDGKTTKHLSLRSNFHLDITHFPLRAGTAPREPRALVTDVTQQVTHTVVVNRFFPRLFAGCHPRINKCPMQLSMAVKRSSGGNT